MKSIFCIKYNKQLFHSYILFTYILTTQIYWVFIFKCQLDLGILSADMMDFIKTK